MKIEGLGRGFIVYSRDCHGWSGGGDDFQIGLLRSTKIDEDHVLQNDIVGCGVWRRFILKKNT